ncbi:unnamed protein product [Spirodela intermedia]|uniref:Uncharacterized protein n=1 Tax=Spirodela intermedia TaxID=51605 RepID=A0A7I8JE73_SPIIN|nr:unnamed protein product [Spirodela intermedia]CAA6667692.1 unnamed protein product [Spirodela intermedia]
MEQRLANTVRMTVIERKFIENGVLSELRVDGQDGQAQVCLGQTRVMAIVTSELVQPYRDRPTEGTLSIFTEFSPMADPSFEAVDMESLCVIAGRFVWAIRVDLHILDNGGNLIDAANAAVLAALLTFRRPECSIEGVDAQEVIMHPPEEREPLPLTIHHLPIAVTFGIFNEGNNLMIDPNHHEEAVMVGRITPGGEGLLPSMIMQCLRIASTKAAEVNAQIERSIDSYNEARLLRQIKLYTSLLSSSAAEGDALNIISIEEEIDALMCRMERLKAGLDRSPSSFQRYGVESPLVPPEKILGAGRGKVNAAIGGPSNWDPYSNGISSDLLRKAMVAPGVGRGLRRKEVNPEQSQGDRRAVGSSSMEEGSSSVQPKSSPRSLTDAVKPKHRRRK